MNFGQMTDGNVLISSACLQTHWPFTASASSHGWMDRACWSCAQPCCSSWMLVPARPTVRRSWLTTPPPGPQMLKVNTNKLLMIHIKCYLFVLTLKIIFRFPLMNMRLPSIKLYLFKHCLIFLLVFMGVTIICE